MTPPSFRELLIAELPALRAYAMVVARSGAEADDLVQDTLERAWKFQNSFREGTRLRAWLFTILRNTHLDTARRHRRTVEDVDGEQAALLTFQPEQHWRAEASDILKSLALLNGKTRHALLLVLGLGLTYEEAAVVCECPVTTVKSRVSRGRLRLLELLDQRVGSAAIH